MQKFILGEFGGGFSRKVRKDLLGEGVNQECVNLEVNVDGLLEKRCAITCQVQRYVYRRNMPQGSNVHGGMAIVENQRITRNLPSGSNIHAGIEIDTTVRFLLPSGNNIHGRIRVQRRIARILPFQSNIHGRIRVLDGGSNQTINLIRTLPIGSNVHGGMVVVVEDNVEGTSVNLARYLPSGSNVHGGITNV